MAIDNLVSVIIPAYNASKYIQKTIDSVLAQTYEKLEVIIVDDGSKDDTVEIIRSNLNRSRKLKFFKQSNRGVAAARNLAIDNSSGEFIAPCDADDLWHRGKIEKQVHLMRESKQNVGFIYSWIMRIDEYDQVVGFGTKFNIRGFVVKPLLYTNFIGGGSTPLIRKACFDKVGKYSLEFIKNNCQGAEDWHLYLKIAGCYAFDLVPFYLVKYRLSNNSMSKNIREMIKSMELANEFAKRKYINKFPEVFRKKEGFLSLSKANYHNDIGQYKISNKFLVHSMLKNPLLATNIGVYRLFTKNCFHIPMKKSTFLMKLKAYKKATLLLESLFERFKKKRLEMYNISVENSPIPDSLEVNN